MNVFIGVLIGFLIGAAAVCLISGFLTRYEAFKAETEDKIKKARKDIRAMEDRERTNDVKTMEQNARFDKRIKMVEEAIAELNRSVVLKEKGRHEVDHT